MRCKNAHLLKPFIFCTHPVHLISPVQSQDATLQLQSVNNTQKDLKSGINMVSLFPCPF